MTSGLSQLESFKEISLSNAFHSAQTFHLEFCIESVQINPTPKGATFHEPIKRSKCKFSCPIVPKAIYLSLRTLMHLSNLSQDKGCLNLMRVLQ